MVNAGLKYLNSIEQTISEEQYSSLKIEIENDFHGIWTIEYINEVINVIK